MDRLARRPAHKGPALEAGKVAHMASVVAAADSIRLAVFAFELFEHGLLIGRVAAGQGFAWTDFLARFDLRRFVVLPIA